MEVYIDAISLVVDVGTEQSCGLSIARRELLKTKLKTTLRSVETFMTMNYAILAPTLMFGDRR